MSQTAVSTPIDLAATVRFASNNKLVLPACSGFQKAIHGNAVLLPLLLAKGGCTPEGYASGVMAGQTTHNRRSSPLRTRKYRRYGDGRDYSNRDGHVQRLFPVSGGNTTIHANEYFDLEGGQTFSSNAVDGDTIYAQIYNSSGALLSTWSSFVNNGQTLQNCWVGGGQLLCGSNAIDVLWYIQLQCNDGAFTMKFYCSNVEFAEGTFTSLP